MARPVFLSCFVLLSCFASALAACAAPPPPEPHAAPLALADVVVAPRHVLRPDCPFPAERTACIGVLGEVSRNDEEAEARLVADYAKLYEARGWRLVHDGPRKILAKPGAPPRCLRLEALMWDDGRAARIRHQLLLRVELEPEDVACPAAAAQ